MADKVSATQNSAVFFFLLCSKNYLNFLVFVASVELHPSGFASWVKQTLFGNSTQTVGLQQNHLELLKKATSLNMLFSRGSNDAMWAKIKSEVSYMDVHVTCVIISAAADLLSGLQGNNHTRGHCCNSKGKKDQ